MIPSTPLPLSTRPSCYSSSSSSEITTYDKNLSPNLSEEDEFVFKLKSSQVFEQEEAVISLRKINAVASLVNLPLEKINKVKIVRLGVVPPLIDVLKGVLRALSPLLHLLQSKSERAQHDSSNRTKLVKLGSISTLLRERGRKIGGERGEVRERERERERNVKEFDVEGITVAAVSVS
uniref:Uncharacterized protein n=1 Tax=Nelumbo nucifera TaxID=4432 RepID=A0A822YI26_NELNU|nr:TPA_asm: hypothetical protein HUJ06_030566 [Nelumbo nucifera]